MSANQADPSAALERLSALVDGELDDVSIAAACAAWRGEPTTRAAWHRYQLIGDVLRSDDLASDPARDNVFLQNLRFRLAQEPVVLAPERWRTADVTPVAAVAGVPRHIVLARRRWAASGAVAAGVVAVASVLVGTRAPAPSSAGAPARLAESTASEVNVTPYAVFTGSPVGATSLATAGFDSSVHTAAVTTFAAEPQSPVASARFIRDARLDRYLAAHKQFAGSSALGVPSVFLRGATAEMSSR